jgi:RES domain-containing protein
VTARRVAVPWQPSYRAVPSCFPPTSLFEDVASADELDVVFLIQSLTNPCLRAEVGEIDLVPKDERVAGPGSSPVMAAFTHLNRAGSRFSDGTWGVYYAADKLETAVAEVSYQCAHFMAQTKQSAIDVDYRVYVAGINKSLHDIRAPRWADVHATDSYGASVALARQVRAAASWGVLYRSVRRGGGQCVAVFRPQAVQLPVAQGAHVSLQWDGKAVAGWYRKSGHQMLCE